MAVEGEVPEKMLRDHRSGYTGFVHLMKWAAIICFIAAMLIIVVISS